MVRPVTEISGSVTNFCKKKKKFIEKDGENFEIISWEILYTTI